MLVRVYYLSFHISLIKHWTFLAYKFCAPCFSFVSHFIKATILLHTHTHVSYCRSISTLDPIDNSYAIAGYDFENLINQVEDEGEDDCEVPGELARMLLQEERAIQPHEEPVESVKLGIEEDRKEVNIGENQIGRAHV